MRTIILLLVTTIFHSSVLSQTIHESLGNITESYNSIWSKTSSTMSIDLIREYPLMTALEKDTFEGTIDTSYYLVMKVSSNTIEQAGFSLGMSLLGTGLGGGSLFHGSSTYNFQKENGTLIMGYDDFLGFYSALNKTYSYISLSGSEKRLFNTVATYSYKDVLFGGEVNAGKLQIVSYFIQVGDAAFSMSSEKFTQIAISLRDMKIEWERHI